MAIPGGPGQPGASARQRVEPELAALGDEVAVEMRRVDGAERVELGERRRLDRATVKARRCGASHTVIGSTKAPVENSQ